MTKGQKIFGGTLLSLLVLAIVVSIIKNKSVEIIPPEDKSYISDSKDLPDKKYLDQMTNKCYEDLGTPAEREVSCKG